MVLQNRLAMVLRHLLIIAPIGAKRQGLLTERLPYGRGRHHRGFAGRLPPESGVLHQELKEPPRWTFRPLRVTREGRQIHHYLSQLQASPLGTSLHAST